MKLRLESRVTHGSVSFEEVIRVGLARVITLGRLDVEIRTGLPTNINSLLLGFSFK